MTKIEKYEWTKKVININEKSDIYKKDKKAYEPIKQ